MNRGEVDQLQEHYRVCPECGLEFMANHGSRRFCCAQHKIIFNNRKKRKEAVVGDRAASVDKFLEQLYQMGRTRLEGKELEQLSLKLNNYWIKVQTSMQGRHLLLYGSYGLERMSQNQYAIIKAIKNE